jgi:hypothetical protein
MPFPEKEVIVRRDDAPRSEYLNWARESRAYWARDMEKGSLLNRERARRMVTEFDKLIAALQLHLEQSTRGS